ncbi:type II toxin-antitoxin system VapC family toxin [Sediminibacterium sp. TEGAF015]|uniref:type II toxin-antitoxin system VapC family toxin n=1 Tax=Sediminibacterium sp. TEGAF015 TaxID=575378 RepID=UPI00220230D1|nr:PIN domain-containing protein [Sediminibacterium sp. TEGAF015]BDQ13308.1 twitching motility protein PilT [Sediminibacterium sp. TEGAF015]
MASKVFLDANILLDFTLKRADYEQSKKIINLAVDGTIEAFMTPSIVHILGYWLAKAYGNLKAKEILLTLLTDITVIDIPHEIVVNSLLSKMNDIEDALQYFTSLHYNLDYFISRDKSLQKQASPTLPIYTPKEFIEEYKL